MKQLLLQLGRLACPSVMYVSDTADVGGLARRARLDHGVLSHIAGWKWLPIPRIRTKPPAKPPRSKVTKGEEENQGRGIL